MKSYVFLIFSLFLGFTLSAQKKVGDKVKGKASFYHHKFNGKKTASGEVYYASHLTCAHRTLPYGTILEVTNLKNRKKVQVKVNDRGPYSKSRIVDLSFSAASALNMLNDGVVEVEIEIMSAPASGDAVKADKKAGTDKADTPKKTDKSDIVDKAKKAIGADATKKEVVKKEETPKKVENTDKKASSYTPPADDLGFKAGKTYSVWGTELNISGYGIQIASYTDVEEAQDLGKEAIDLGLQPIYIQAGWANKQRVYRVIVGSFPTKKEAAEEIRKVKEKGFNNGFLKSHF